MKIGIPKELNDQRVAMVPSVISKFKDLDVTFLLEDGAGLKSDYPNETYEDKCQIVDRDTLLKQADIIVSVNPLSMEDYAKTKDNTSVVSMFAPYFDDTIVGKLQEAKVQAFSFDMIPRTSLAQSMDVLSSMAAIAGYKAVLVATEHLPRYMPMMITAAGSIKPAKVLVLGAGVAGLQAIATAKRLGAMVEAFDTRAAAKEEVESLGGKFIVVEGAADDTNAGGYAVQQSEDYIKRQRQEVQNRAMKADIIITTAQVRGRKAPVLVPEETVLKMRAGSVVVDLAASTGGNCALTQDNKVIKTTNGVTIVGDSYLASKVAQDASFLFSNNTLNFLKMLIKDGKINLDMENVIIAGALITQN